MVPAPSFAAVPTGCHVSESTPNDRSPHHPVSERPRPLPRGATIKHVAIPPQHPAARLALLVALGVGASAVGQTDLEWQLVSPLPTAADLHDVAWGAGRYLAVGSDGTVLTSPDMVGWEVLPCPTTADLLGVTWTGTRFVAVGDEGTVLVSPDGQTFDHRQTGVDRRLRDVAAGPSGLLAVGDGGVVLWSGDGDAWAVGDSGVTAALNAVTRAGSRWVAVGDASTAVASDDGVAWSRLAVGGLVQDLQDVAWHAGHLAVVGESAYRVGPLEQDLSQGWRSPPGPLRAVVACGGRFVAVGDRGRHGRDDGDGALEPAGRAHQELWLAGAACGPDGALGVGRGGQVASSPDGLRWRHRTAPTSLTLRDLAVGPSGGVAVGVTTDGDSSRGESGVILTSGDGATWEVAERVVGRETRAVAAGDGRLVVVGGTWFETPWSSALSKGWAWTSTDGGLAWRLHDVDGPAMEAVTWDGRRFLALASDRPFIWRRWFLGESEDGEAWSFAELAGGDDLAADGERVVVVDGTVVRWSRDLVAWTEVDPGAGDATLHRVAWGGGRFVLVADAGLVLTSPDGLAWSPAAAVTTADLVEVEWTGSGFLAAGIGGVVLASDDGLQWQLIRPADGTALWAVGEVGGAVVAAGTDGRLERAVPASVGAPPEVAFVWLPAPAEVGAPVRFVDRTANGPTWWSWSFGDGATADGPSATHTYAGEGTYSAELMAGNDQGSDSATAAVRVTTPCTGPPPPHLEAPAEVLSGEPYTVSWNAGGSPEYEVQEGTDPTFASARSLVTAALSEHFLHRWEWAPEVHYRARAVGLCPDGEVTGPWSPPVTVRIRPTLDDPPPVRVVVPVAAHGHGLAGTTWRTDLVVHNPDDRATRGLLYLLDAGAPCDHLGEVELGPGSSVPIVDVAATLCGGRPVVGPVVLASRLPLQATSRTVNASGQGEVGGALPALPVAGAFQPGEVRRLLRLERSAAYRTNLGLSNIGESWARVRVAVTAGDGLELMATEVDLAGQSHRQLTDLLGGVGGGVADAWAEVTLLDGPEEAVLAYASVVDNSTGDASNQVALPPAPACTVTASSALPPGSRCVTAGAGLLVVGGGGQLATLAGDGRGWTVHPLPHPWHSLFAVGWNGLRFVAVGNVAMVSEDGSKWQRFEWFDRPLRRLASDGSRWVAVGDGGTVATSPDGRLWEVDQLSTGGLTAVVWAGDRFVVGTALGSLFHSPTGSSWERVQPGLQVQDLAWGADTLVAAEHHRLHWTTDLEHWHLALEGDQPLQVRWAGDRFLAVGHSTLYVSPDGRQWRPLPCSGEVSRDAGDLAWDGVGLVTVDRGRLIRVAPHGGALVVPGVAHLDGQGGARWRTELELLNHGSDDAACRLELLQQGQGNPDPRAATVAVPANQAVRLPDVLDTVFGASGSAAVRVSPDRPTVEVAARTFDDEPDGTVGQGVPPRAEADAGHLFREARLIGLAHSAHATSGSRTNLLVVSACAEGMAVDAALHRGNGELLGALRFDLAPFEYRQLNNAFAAVTSESVDDGFAVLSTGHLRCAFHAAASVVDNRSGDPTFVVPP